MIAEANRAMATGWDDQTPEVCVMPRLRLRSGGRHHSPGSRSSGVADRTAISGESRSCHAAPPGSAGQAALSTMLQARSQMVQALDLDGPCRDPMSTMI
jgi:hypothetical protein